jgi:hypothetical protein
MPVDTATVDADKSMTVSSSESGIADPRFNLNVLQFRDSDGVGASVSNNTTGTPSISITTTQDNSAVAVIIIDWNAADGASRTWLTVNSITPTSGNGGERTYFRNASFYTVYAAYWSDVGAAGAKTVGLSAPGSQQYSIIAVEVKGAASSATLDQEGFSFGLDDGSESAHTLGTQDSNLTAPLNTPQLLRFIINATGSVGAKTFKLQWRRSTEGTNDWKDVT